MEMVCWYPTWSFDRCGLWLNKGCQTELGTGTQQRSTGGQVGKICAINNRHGSGKGSLQLVICSTQGNSDIYFCGNRECLLLKS